MVKHWPPDTFGIYSSTHTSPYRIFVRGVPARFCQHRTFGVTSARKSLATELSVWGLGAPPRSASDSCTDFTSIVDIINTSFVRPQIKRTITDLLIYCTVHNVVANDRKTIHNNTSMPQRLKVKRFLMRRSGVLQPFCHHKKHLMRTSRIIYRYKCGTLTPYSHHPLMIKLTLKNTKIPISQMVGQAR